MRAQMGRVNEYSAMAEAALCRLVEGPSTDSKRCRRLSGQPPPTSMRPTWGAVSTNSCSSGGAGRAPTGDLGQAGLDPGQRPTTRSARPHYRIAACAAAVSVCGNWHDAEGNAVLEATTA